MELLGFEIELFSGSITEGIKNFFLYSKTFLVIKIIIGIYCAIIIFNIIFLTKDLTLFGKGARKAFMGSKAKPESYGAVEEMSDIVQLSEVYKKIASESPSDWKIAVIEADKVLDKALEAKGYTGESLGDRLKQLTPSDIPGIYEEVWEAHKIRNRIVHEPDFEISQNETRNVVGVFRRAIKKFI